MYASLWARETVDSFCLFCFISILNHGISHQGRMIHSRILANEPGIGEPEIGITTYKDAVGK